MSLAVLSLVLDSYWTGDSGSSQATVPIRVLAQVLLVVILGVVKRLRFGYFSGDRTVTFLCQDLEDKCCFMELHRFNQQENVCVIETEK